MSGRALAPLTSELYGEGPAREPRFTVVERWAECMNALDLPERELEFLHRQMNEEANVMENAASSLAEGSRDLPALATVVGAGRAGLVFVVRAAVTAGLLVEAAAESAVSCPASISRPKREPNGTRNTGGRSPPYAMTPAA